MTRKEENKTCKFCYASLSDAEYHEEFDFYKHPDVKRILRRLRDDINQLPENERLYGMENFAVKKGWLNDSTRHICESAGGQIRPDGGQVVVPQYSSLFEAYKWLRKLEEVEPPVPEYIP